MSLFNNRFRLLCLGLTLSTSGYLSLAPAFNGLARHSFSGSKTMTHTHADRARASNNRRQSLFINKRGEIAIDVSKYQGVRSFSEGLAAVWLPDDNWGFIDKTGSMVIPPRYQEVLSFSEGLAAVQIKGLWGFINREGHLVIPPQYEVANSFHEGIAVVRKSRVVEAPAPPGKSPLGFIQVKTLRTSQTTRSDLMIRTEITPNMDVLLIDMNGQTVLSKNTNDIQFEVEGHPRFSDGLILVWNPKIKKYGYIDRTGKVAIEPKYSNAAPFSEGLARIAVFQGGDEKLGFISRNGQFVIPPRFNTDGNFARNSTDFSEGLAALTEDLNPTLTEKGRFAYIDKQGNVVLLTEFSAAGPFREGLAEVFDENGGKWGYIDKSGKLVIPTLYEFADPFSEGLALVVKMER